MAKKHFLVYALACGLLTACAGSEKTTTTKIENPDGSVTTTTTTEKAAPAGNKVSREVEADAPVDPNNTTVIMGQEPGSSGEIEAHTDDNGNSRVHVNMPGVHINADESSDHVNIDVPFVHIHKDGGGRTHIKAPFVRINAKDE